MHIEEKKLQVKTLDYWHHLMLFTIKRSHEKSINRCLDLPGGPVVENLSANAGCMGSTLALGRVHMLQGS